MKIKSILLTLFIALLAFAIGYRFSRKNSVQSLNVVPASSTTANEVFAMNVLASGVPFWIDARETWEKLPQSFPQLKTVFGGPLDTNAQKQAEEMEALISQKVNGIVIAPADSKALTTEINHAIDAGIPVVTILTDEPQSKRMSYITSELEVAGEKIGNLIAAQAGNKGKVVICYAQAGNEEQERRAHGIQMAISSHPEMQVVTSIEDRFDENVGAEALKTLLIQHPDISVIAGCNSRSAVGAVIALKELGYKPGQVKISGWDFDNDLLHFIGEGWVQGSVAQNSRFIAYLAYSMLESAKFQMKDFAEGGHRFLPETIIVPVTIITEKNYQDFLRQ